ncbi:MAG: hypothetical protein ACXQTR_01045 [Candidatus Methanospirareceae archaeon]
MKARKFSGHDAHRVLSGMVHNSEVVSRIAAKWVPEGMFASRNENLIGHWAVDYWRKYNQPIGENVETTAARWASSSHRSEASISALEKTLSAVVSKDGERMNPDYILDVAGRLFNRVAMRRLIDNVESDLDRGDVDRGGARLEEWRRVEMGAGAVIKLGEDFDSWLQALEGESIRPLVTYPGALGTFLGGEVSRDSLVVFMGSSKRGKSWWLIDLAFRAARQRCRVAYFEAGDMSQRQVQLRLGQRSLLRPRSDRICILPTGWNDEGELITESRQLSPVSARDCFRRWKKLLRGRDRFRLSCHSNSSLSVSGIESYLSSWARDGWVADVVVIDYADILAPPAGRWEYRHAINENWKHLRRISQDYHCAVVTATQADAQSYDKALLSRKNFNEDRRVHDHVTAMIGINMTTEEKKKGVCRLNWLDRRGEDFNEQRQVKVAGCLDVGCPSLKSMI